MTQKTHGERREEGWDWIGHDGVYEIFVSQGGGDWLVTSPTSEYNVTATKDGILYNCNCPNFTHEKAKDGEGCKHIEILDKCLRQNAKQKAEFDKDFEERAEKGKKIDKAKQKKSRTPKPNGKTQAELDQERKEMEELQEAFEESEPKTKRTELLVNISTRLIDAKLFKEIDISQLDSKLKNLKEEGLVHLIKKYDEQGWDKFCSMYKIECDKPKEKPKKPKEEHKLPPEPPPEGAIPLPSDAPKDSLGPPNWAERPPKEDTTEEGIPLSELGVNNNKNTAIATVQKDDQLDVIAGLEMRTKLGQLYEGVMKKGTDYGVIPGTPKPTLLKPGAEILRTATKLEPEEYLTDNCIYDWNKGFFYIEARCILRHHDTGKVMGDCTASCNSWEGKYMYRWEYVKHGQKAPEGAKTRKTKEGYEQYQIVNNDPYTLVNTLQKMAEKRAFVGATLMATGASSIFTQDLEDMGDAIQKRKRR